MSQLRRCKCIPCGYIRSSNADMKECRVEIVSDCGDCRSGTERRSVVESSLDPVLEVPCSQHFNDRLDLNIFFREISNHGPLSSFLNISKLL
jgi:hypothetical protein